MGLFSTFISSNDKALKRLAGKLTFWDGRGAAEPWETKEKREVKEWSKLADDIRKGSVWENRYAAAHNSFEIKDRATSLAAAQNAVNIWTEKGGPPFGTGWVAQDGKWSKFGDEAPTKGWLWGGTRRVHRKRKGIHCKRTRRNKRKGTRRNKRN